MHLPLESQLASKPQILLSVFRKYIVLTTESILLHPVYQQEAFVNILYTGSPWFATIHSNDGFETRRQKIKKKICKNVKKCVTINTGIM